MKTRHKIVFRLLLLVPAACAPMAGTEKHFPPALRGTWVEEPASCTAPGMRIGATTLDARGSRCVLQEVGPAASGAVLARLACDRPAGPATQELARLRVNGDRLTMQVGGAQLDWTRCG